MFSLKPHRINQSAPFQLGPNHEVYTAAEDKRMWHNLKFSVYFFYYDDNLARYQYFFLCWVIPELTE